MKESSAKRYFLVGIYYFCVHKTLNISLKMKKLLLIFLFTLACAVSYGQSEGSNRTIDVYFSWGEYYKSCPYQSINNEHYILFGDNPVKLNRTYVERKNPDNNKYEPFYYTCRYLETDLLIKDENPAAAAEDAKTGKSRKQNSQIGSAAKEVGKEIGRAVGEEVKKEVKRAVTEKAKKAAGKLLRNLLN